MFFYGGILDILGKQKIKYRSDVSLPDKLTVEGRIGRNDFADFDATVLKLLLVFSFVAILVYKTIKGSRY